MAGGLITLVAFGAQDLYLTGCPEITLFKVVYRRYTNFSIESIKIEFDDDTGLNKTSRVTLPIYGDLINKIYLKIKIPEIILDKNTCDEEAICIAVEKYNKDIENLKNISLFYVYNTDIYRKAICNWENVQITTQNIIDLINDEFECVPPEVITNFIKSVPKQFDVNLLILNQIIKTFTYQSDLNEYTNKQLLVRLLNYCIEQDGELLNYMTNQKNMDFSILQDLKSNRYKCAWIKRLGHFIFEYFDIYIRGNRIDRQWSDYVNINWELSGNKNSINKYYEMIGNVEELIVFNDDIKPEYTMIIPIPFWFCDNYGLSLPIVAMEYSDIILELKTRPLEDLFYVEPDAINTIIGLKEEIESNVKISLLVDYIYLSDCERKKFATSAHEYLIEQIQWNYIYNVYGNQYSFSVDFFHPTKELIWVLQPIRFINNDNWTNENKWWNYTNTPDGSINPIINCQIEFNGEIRVPTLEGSYYDIVQPYDHHKNNPILKGINLYSFALKHEFQPMGSCNFSRLSIVKFFLNIDPSITPFNIRVYAKNMNILRIIQGFTGVAFV